MRIRVLVSRAGIDLATGKHFSQPPGYEYEEDDNTALRMIAAKQAEPINVGRPAQETPRQWELRISPAEYLERFPNGPNAERARELLA